LTSISIIKAQRFTLTFSADKFHIGDAFALSFDLGRIGNTITRMREKYSLLVTFTRIIGLIFGIRRTNAAAIVEVFIRRALNSSPQSDEALRILLRIAEYKNIIILT